jgi:hypothetical protein
MPKATSAPKSEDHPIATAIGKALGTIVKKAGLATAEPPAARKKERLPRKQKKALKKDAMAARAA